MTERALRARLARLEGRRSGDAALEHELREAPLQHWLAGQRLEEAENYPRAWRWHCNFLAELFKRPGE